MTQLVFPFAKAARAKAYARAKSSKIHLDILELLGKHPELNRQEIADLLHKGIQCVCRPVRDLLDSKQIVETGGFRRTRCGGDASLVKLPPKKRKRSPKAKGGAK
ncbi:MAG: hypothetical protein U0930_03490 [Pirellulales bacterium]